MMHPTRAAALALLVLLGACGTSMQTQENWAANMAATYPPGTPAADVEASVTAAGMTFEPVPDAFRTLPRSITTDGSGYWRRAAMVDEALACRMEREVFFRFDDADRLMTVYPGDSTCL